MNNVNKNNLILAISACLIVFSIILVSIASIVEHKKEERAEATALSQSVVSDENAPESLTQAPSANTTAPVTQSNGYKTGKYKIATENDPLTMREYPNEGRVGEVPKGETVEVLAVYEEWGYVLYEGQNGWISLTLADLVSATEVTTTNKPGKYTINTQDDPLGIRTQITDGDRNGEIPKGTTVDILAVCKGDKGEYGLVKYNDTIGWLPFEYLKVA